MIGVIVVNIDKLPAKCRSASFPKIMAVIFFEAFIAIYYLLTQRVIRPHYYLGLLFGIPFLCFAAIACWSKRHIQEESTPMLTGTLAITFRVAFVLMVLITVPGTMIYDAVSNVTDIGSYERVLKRSCFQDYLIADFPDKLPEDAKNTKLYYSPFAIGQGGQELGVCFQASTETIKEYTKIFSNEAGWIGSESDAEANQYGIVAGEFSYLDGSTAGLSEDYKVYVISSKPYSADWNHGEHSLAAISEKKNEIMFWVSKW